MRTWNWGNGLVPSGERTLLTESKLTKIHETIGPRYVWQIWVNIGSGNDLLPDKTKPLLNQCWLINGSGFVAPTHNQFYRKCSSRYYFIKWVWRTHLWITSTSSRGQWVNLCDLKWQHRSGSTLAQAMACCLMAPSHYLNQCWLIVSEALRHSPEGNFTEDAQAIYPWYQFENY